MNLTSIKGIFSFKTQQDEEDKDAVPLPQLKIDLETRIGILEKEVKEQEGLSLSNTGNLQKAKLHYRKAAVARKKLEEVQKNYDLVVKELSASELTDLTTKTFKSLKQHKKQTVAVKKIDEHDLDEYNDLLEDERENDTLLNEVNTLMLGQEEVVDDEDEQFKSFMLAHQPHPITNPPQKSAPIPIVQTTKSPKPLKPAQTPYKVKGGNI
jgi:hypothetical protein